MEPLFPLGAVVATPAALRLMSLNTTDYRTLLAKHQALDPGMLGPDDVAANHTALKQGLRIFSKFAVGDEPIYIVTDGDFTSGEHLHTVILLPTEY